MCMINEDSSLWVVLLQDRHVDVDVEVWPTREAAEARAGVIAETSAAHPEYISHELTPLMQEQGWTMNIRFSVEDGYVRVQPTEMRGLQ